MVLFSSLKNEELIRTVDGGVVDNWQQIAIVLSHRLADALDALEDMAVPTDNAVHDAGMVAAA